MDTLIAIDPGKCTGLALFENGELKRADASGTSFDEIMKLNEFYARGMVSKAVLEIPQVYDRKNWKGSPNDLIKLSIVAGKWALWLEARGFCVDYITPHRWKGNRSKEADNNYTMKRLEGPEVAVIPSLPKYKKHNVLDAIGLGLWALKR